MKLTLVADSHTKHWDVKVTEPSDYLIFAGDGEFRYASDLVSFNKWVKKLKTDGLIKEAIVIAGNHDFYCETSKILTKKWLEDCIYLEEESYTLSNGMKLWGSPFTPVFKNWAFLKTDSELKQNWQKIPEDTDILVTHGPAYGILDFDNRSEDYLGSKSLKKRIKELKNIKYHFFGHIHRDKGHKRELKEKNLTSVNCGVLDNRYEMIWDPIIIEI